MALSNEQLITIRSELNDLFEITAATITDWKREHARTLIDVGEYPLALDEIAAAYQVRGFMPGAKAASLILKLASEMRMEEDPEYEPMMGLLKKLRAR